MKKISMILILCILMFVLLPMAAIASTDEVIDKEISAAEFEKAIQYEAQKYGIKCELEDIDSTTILTESILKDAIAEIKTTGEAYLKKDTKNNQTYVTKTLEAKQDEISPYNMPIEQRAVGYFYLGNSNTDENTLHLTSQKMLLEVDVTMDANSNYIITIDDYDIRKIDGGIALKEWELVDITFSKNKQSNGQTVNGIITATVRTNSTFGADFPISFTYTFDETHIVVIDCR